MGNLSHNNDLAEKLNSQFVEAVLPVTVFVGIEACVGLLGNVLVLYVFSFKYHKCNFKYFVLFLALIDLTSCLTTIPGEMVTQSFWYTYPVPMVCKAKSFFNVFTVCASALCLLLIAIDRYRKICKPFGWQVKSKIAIYLCICALFISGIVATPVAIYWGVQDYNVTYNNSTVNVRSCETDEKYKRTQHPLIYSSMIEVIITIPMVVMAILYFLIAREIRRSMHQTTETRSSTADSAKDSVQLLSTLSAVLEIINPCMSDKDNFKINEAGKMNEVSADNERNEDKDSSTSIAQADYVPDNRSEDRLVNPYKRNTEFAICMDSNVIDTLDPERVDGTKTYKSKHGTTKEKDDVRSISTASDAVRVNVCDGKRKMSSRRAHPQIKRKTLIMFILSAVFIITTILYLTLLSLIASEDNILESLSSERRAVYFFFFRFYFIHHAINPFVYAFLDWHFKEGLREMARAIKKRIFS